MMKPVCCCLCLPFRPAPVTLAPMLTPHSEPQRTASKHSTGQRCAPSLSKSRHLHHQLTQGCCHALLQPTKRLEEQGKTVHKAAAAVAPELEKPARRLAQRFSALEYVQVAEAILKVKE